ncbi:MAG: hypothetical protein V7638_3832 [Acidobacteriota bacterium]|jgi:ATP-dependent protease HslVU (ClpYQ) peptidase subunit
MTCIVGFTDRGVAYIGADARVSYGEHHYTVQSGRKLFTIGEYLFGAAGAVRYEQALRSTFKPPAIPEKYETSGELLHSFLITDFVPELLICLRKFPGLFDMQKGLADSEFLLAVRGYVFEFDSDLTVTRPDNGLLSIGTGARLALGALHATQDMNESAMTTMKRALRAASYYDKCCGPPFFWGWTVPGQPAEIAPLTLS